MSFAMLDKLLPNVLPKELLTKGNFDKLNGVESKKPEVATPGISEHPSSVQLDKITGDKAILPQPPNLYKQTGEVVSIENSQYPDEGFVKVPRSLINSIDWQDLKLKQRHVFQTILYNSCYKPRKYTYNGKTMILMPGQQIISLRELADLCNKSVKFKDEKVDHPFVQRAVSIFFRLGWIDTASDTGKNLITITYPEIYEHFLKQNDTASDTVNDTASIHKRRTKEREERKGAINDVSSPLSNENKKIEPSASYQPSPSIHDPSPSSNQPKFSESQIKEDFSLICNFVQEKKIPLKPEELERWIRNHGGHTVLSNLDLMTRQKNLVRSPGAWMERAIREDWAKLKKNEPVNKKFAEAFKAKNNWTELSILQKYCTIERTGYDLPFNFDPETFKAVLMSKYENLFRYPV